MTREGFDTRKAQLAHGNNKHIMSVIFYWPVGLEPYILTLGLWHCMGHCMGRIVSNLSTLLFEPYQ